MLIEQTLEKMHALKRTAMAEAVTQQRQSSQYTDLRRACLSSKASEMYFRKMIPRTTCLYSAASIEPRKVSAICQSSAS